MLAAGANPADYTFDADAGEAVHRSEIAAMKPADLQSKLGLNPYDASVMGMRGPVTSALTEGLNRMGAGLASAGAKLTGIDALENARKYSQNTAEFLASKRQPGALDTTLGIGAGLATQVPMYMANFPAAMAINATTAGGEGAELAKEAGKGGGAQIVNALARGGTSAIMDAVGGRVAGPIAEAGFKSAAPMVQKAGTLGVAGLAGAAENAVTQAGFNAADKITFDPRKDLMEGVPTSALVGAAVPIGVGAMRASTGPSTRDVSSIDPAHELWRLQREHRNDPTKLLEELNKLKQSGVNIPDNLLSSQVGLSMPEDQLVKFMTADSAARAAAAKATPQLAVLHDAIERGMLNPNEISTARLLLNRGKPALDELANRQPGRLVENATAQQRNALIAKEAQAAATGKAPYGDVPAQSAEGSLLADKLRQEDAVAKEQDAFASSEDKLRSTAAAQRDAEEALKVKYGLRPEFVFQPGDIKNLELQAKTQAKLQADEQARIVKGKEEFETGKRPYDAGEGRAENTLLAEQETAAMQAAAKKSAAEEAAKALVQTADTTVSKNTTGAENVAVAPADVTPRVNNPAVKKVDEQSPLPNAGAELPKTGPDAALKTSTPSQKGADVSPTPAGKSNPAPEVVAKPAVETRVASTPAAHAQNATPAVKSSAIVEPGPVNVKAVKSTSAIPAKLLEDAEADYHRLMSAGKTAEATDLAAFLKQGGVNVTSAILEPKYKLRAGPEKPPEKPSPPGLRGGEKSIDAERNAVQARANELYRRALTEPLEQAKLTRAEADKLVDDYKTKTAAPSPKDKVAAPVATVETKPAEKQTVAAQAPAPVPAPVKPKLTKLPKQPAKPAAAEATGLAAAGLEVRPGKAPDTYELWDKATDEKLRDLGFHETKDDAIGYAMKEAKGEQKAPVDLGPAPKGMGVKNNQAEAFRERGKGESLLDYAKAKREASGNSRKPYEQSIEELKAITETNRQKMEAAREKGKESAYTHYKFLVKKGEMQIKHQEANPIAQRKSLGTDSGSIIHPAELISEGVDYALSKLRTATNKLKDLADKNDPVAAHAYNGLVQTLNEGTTQGQKLQNEYARVFRKPAAAQQFAAKIINYENENRAAWLGEIPSHIKKDVTDILAIHDAMLNQTHQIAVDNNILINDRGELRPHKAVEFYTPGSFSKDMLTKLNSPNPKVRDAAVNEFIDALELKHGYSRADAEAEAAGRFKLSERAIDSDVEFDPLHKPATYPPPPGWSGNPLEAMNRYLMKFAVEVAKHKHLDSDPTLGPMMQNQRADLDPWGRVREREPGSGHAADTVNELFKGAVDSIGIQLNPGRQNAINKAATLASRGAVQTTATLMDSAQALPNAIDDAGLKNSLKALVNVASEYGNLKSRGHVRDTGTWSSAKVRLAEALQQPGVRGKFHALLDTANEGQHVLSKLTLTDQMNKANSAFSALAGVYKAKEALANGDDKFFQKVGLPNWRELEPTAVEDHVARWVQKGAQSSMGAEDVPVGLLKNDSFAGGLFGPLIKWSAGFSNQQIDRVFKPMMHGDFKPALVRIVGGAVTTALVNEFKEWALNKKPQGMSWTEWAAAGAPNPVTHLVQQARNAQVLPIITGVAAALTGQANMPRNLGAEAPAKTAQRLSQFFTATRDMEADDVMTLIDQLFQDNMATYRDIRGAMKPADELATEEGKYKAATAPANFDRFKMNDPFSLNLQLNRAKTHEEALAIAQKIVRTARKDTAEPSIAGPSTDPEFITWLQKTKPELARVTAEKNIADARAVGRDMSNLFAYKKQLAKEAADYIKTLKPDAVDWAKSPDAQHLVTKPDKR